MEKIKNSNNSTGSAYTSLRGLRPYGSKDPEGGPPKRDDEAIPEIASASLGSLPRNDKRFGFTLTELLIVIVILGILAAVAVPRFFPQAEKSRVAEALGILSAIRQGEESYYLENGAYCRPSSAGSGTLCSNGWASLGLDTPSGRYFTTFSVTVPTATTFTASAQRNTTNDPQSLYGSKYITLTETGSWCTSGCTTGVTGTCHPFCPPN